jgi:FkbM family methyltransferase
MRAVRARLARYPLFAALARIKLGFRLRSITTTPRRFLAAQALARPGIAVYRLRDAADLCVAVRHGTPDVAALEQIFHQGTHAETPRVTTAITALGRAPRVLDLGGNVGMWAVWATGHWPGAAVTSVEPDPANLTVLERAAEANGGNWRIVAAAAGVRAGTMRFVAGNYGTSRAALPGEGGRSVVDVPVVDALELIGEHDVIKLDIEGGEWAILADERLRDADVAALTVEYHAHLCPSADTHGLAQSLLHTAGFEVQRIPHVDGAPPEEGVLWAWRDDTSA